jgi:hypothetical protein
LTSISTSGVPALAQPAAADLSDVASLATLTGAQTLTNKVLGGSGSTTPDTQINRLRANQGTTMTTGQVSSISGFGSTASCSAASGTDTAGSITILSNGTGQADNATLTITFKDGAWATAPLVICNRGDSNGPSAQWVVSSVTTTAINLVFNNAVSGQFPVAGSSYVFRWIAIGK